MWLSNSKRPLASFRPPAASTPGACSIPKASLYYSGMRNRADAFVINLATDEKRDDIDFTIPAR